MATIECSLQDKIIRQALPSPISGEPITFLREQDVLPEVWKEFQQHNRETHNGMASLLHLPDPHGY